MASQPPADFPARRSGGGPPPARDDVERADRLKEADGVEQQDAVDVVELTQLALAADPDVEIPEDAVPFGTDDRGRGLLPEWYMPAPAGVRRSRSTRIVVAGVVVALALVNAVGLCVTYGLPEIAW